MANGGVKAIAARLRRSVGKGVRSVGRPGVGAMVAACGAAAMIGGVGLAAKSSLVGPVAVQFSPWTQFAERVDRVDRAGGVVVGAGAGAGAGFVWAIGPEGDDDFHDRLREEGAWLILDEETVFWASADS